MKRRFYKWREFRGWSSQESPRGLPCHLKDRSGRLRLGRCGKGLPAEPHQEHLGSVFRELAAQRESNIVEGHLMADHVHILISIPPKYAVAQVVGFIKGKSAIHIARTYLGRRRNFMGQNFWTRGYFVTTVGKDETTV